MSKATKRKHVTREVLDDFVTPEDKQIIVKIVGSRGNNLHEAETPTGDHFLISMPSKFRKNVWIKRGNFVIVDPIAEGNKVCAEIVHILYPEQVKHLKKEGLWPEKFMEKPADQNGHFKLTPPNTTVKNPDFCSDSDSDSETDEDSDLFVNTNHLQSLVICSDSDTSDENSDEEETEQKDITDNNMNKVE